MVSTLEVIPLDPETETYKVTTCGNRSLDDMKKTGKGIIIDDFANVTDLVMEGGAKYSILDAEQGFDWNITKTDSGLLHASTIRQ